MKEATGSNDQDGDMIYREKYEYGDPLFSDPFEMYVEESEDRQLLADKYGDLPHYKPLFYSRYGNATKLGVSPREKFNMSETMNFTVILNDTHKDHEINIDKLPLYKVKMVALKNEHGCGRLKGYYDVTIKQCKLYHKMSNICIRVNKAESSFNGKQWILNHTDVEGPFGCFGETHDVILYEQILLKTGQDIESMMPLDFENLHFEVRNAYDPWMAAIELTEDTMNFGMKTKNMRFLGIGLMFCCGGLLLQPCFWMFRNFFWSWSIEDSVDRLAAQHYIVDVERSN